MRLLYILIERIKSHLKNHRVIVGMFLLGIFTSTLFFTYYYGDNVKANLEQEEPELMAVYRIQSEKGFMYDDTRIRELEKESLVTFYYTFTLNKELSSDIFFTGFEEDVETDAGLKQITCMARRNNEYEHEIRYGFGDLKSNDSGILLSYDLIHNIHIENLKHTDNAFLNLNGENMEILGIHGHAHESCIPFKYVVERDLKANVIEIRLSKKLKENETHEYANYLGEVFPEAFSVSTGYEIYEDILKSEESTQGFRLQKAMLILLLSVFTFMFLAKYLFDMSANEDIIYRMLGTEREKVALVALGEIIILALSAILLAIFTHVALFDTIFLPMSKYSSLYFTHSDYLVVILSSLFVCIVACLPFIMIVWRKSVISAKNMVQ